MFRFLVAAALVAACSAFAPATPALQLSKVAARSDDLVMMARAPPKKAAKAAKAAAPKKVAPKKVVAKKVAPKKAPAKKAPVKKSLGKSPEGKGGIFPWIT